MSWIKSPKVGRGQEGSLIYSALLILSLINGNVIDIHFLPELNGTFLSTVRFTYENRDTVLETAADTSA